MTRPVVIGLVVAALVLLGAAWRLFRHVRRAVNEAINESYQEYDQ